MRTATILACSCLFLMQSAQVHAVGQASVSGKVFLDRNANGRLDAGELGVAGVAVSNQQQVVLSGTDGAYVLPAPGNTGIVFVSVPNGYGSRDWFRRTSDSNMQGRAVDFALTQPATGQTLTFVHASDTHLSQASLARTTRLRALVDSIRPDFVLITGDLVRDALRVGEAEATGYYELFQREVAKIVPPVYTVPGNHEIFGIERDTSKVSAQHPLYGRAMYRHYRGPDYYSFNAGGVHFVGLNTVDIDDTRYYGHVDSAQLAWLERDVAVLPPGTPVVTFNHIPLYSSSESVKGYVERPPAPSVITVGGKSQYRHTVSNALDVLVRLRNRPYPLALGGHIHSRELLRYEGIATRFEQAAAIVAPFRGLDGVLPSGVTVYRINSARVDEGQFVPLGIDK